MKALPAPWLVVAAVAAVVALAVTNHVMLIDAVSTEAAGNRAFAAVFVARAELPRLAMALVAGAALGLSSALLQRVLRNPLAEPATLGLSAGAQLALVAATIALPAVMAYPVAVAFSGAAATALLVLAATARRRFEPLAVILTGMMASLTATAGAAAVILASGDYMTGLFIWGGGDLTQDGWGPTLRLATILAVASTGTLLALRPLTLLTLGDAEAKAAGLATGSLRLVVIALAVWLAAATTAEIGIVGFIGLAAPLMARLTGIRSSTARMAVAPVFGALLLSVADGAVQLAGHLTALRIPTGAATALLGGPLILALVPGIANLTRPDVLPAPTVLSRRPAGPVLVALAIVLMGAIATALLAGRGAGGWHFDPANVDWRLARVSLLAAAGALIGMAGTVVQRLTGNPMASPEVLGVGVGAGAGLAVVLITAPLANLAAQATGMMVGAVATLSVLLAFVRRHGFGAERLLIGGIALGALLSSILTSVIATGSPAGFRLLGWISGLLVEPTAGMATGMATILAGLTPLVLVNARPLAILPLGETTARSLGLATTATRAGLVLIAGAATAASTLAVGPMSFIGLIAPHIARSLGLRRPAAHLLGAMLSGAALTIGADWLARVVAFPYQLPLGLFAALIGGGYLVVRFARGSHA